MVVGTLAHSQVVAQSFEQVVASNLGHIQVAHNFELEESDLLEVDP